MNKAPCKECNDRAPACHDTCLAYRGWAAALKERQKRADIGTLEIMNYIEDKKRRAHK